jgi:glycosyltransferase involved in cell wall biosynthesis
VQVVYGTTTVVDTGHTSGWPVTTGIQRVVREVVRRWLPTHPLRLVGWTEDLTAMRGLDRQETHLIARWGELASEQGSGEGTELVIPWHTTYLLPEVPPGEERMARLAALAQYSGSRVLLIGYDLIPTTNVELVPAGLAENFSDYLTLVKHSRRVVAISETAAREFRGFMHAIQSQGLPGPEIVTCLLPAAPPPPGLPHQFESLPLDDDVPVVLMVGSIEARKNHLAVLQAAELLWREGIRFRLLILGNTNINSSEVVGRIHELDQEGRDVHLRSGVSDAALGDAYQQSRVLVFVSTHEGYGLPVAEALAAGTPVITTSFGSTAEAAEGGGALLVDPYDDEAITDALRKVLLDDSLQADLTARARARPSRGWDDYARELWSFTEEGGAA